MAQKLIADKEAELDFIQTVLSIGEEFPGRLNAELAQQTISKDCFTDKEYWEIFLAAKEIARQGESVRPHDLAAILGPDKRSKVFAVFPQVPRLGGLHQLSVSLKGYASRRAAAEIGRRIVQEAETPVGAFGASIVLAAAALQASFSPDGSGVVNGHEVLRNFYDDLEKAQIGDSSLHVVPTGIRPMDEVVGGLPKRFLSIIGAYPGCFKSGIMATVAANIAASGRKVGFFSLEDNPTWLAKRYASRATGIPVESLGRRRLSKNELDSIAETQDSVANVMGNLFIDGRSNLSGFDVASSARYMIAQYKCEVIVIDHIGEMQTKDRRKDRYDLDVAENVRAVRDVAKDCTVAVLMAAHLRRRQDSEEDIHRIPKMTDFSDSSSIEKMCRLALGLWQPPDNESQVAMKVLKMNEGAGRGITFNLNKDAKSALVLNR